MGGAHPLPSTTSVNPRFERFLPSTLLGLALLGEPPESHRPRRARSTMVRTRRYQGTLPAVSMSAAASLLAWSTLIAWSARSMPGAAQQPGGSPDSSTRVPTRRYQGALPVVSMSGASLSP
jgi:hypothetical protein